MKFSPQMKALALMILGALLLVLARVLFSHGDIATHFHANFAVFIDNQRLDLTADKYMEDVEGCKPGYLPLFPEERVHMHNNEDVVAHVHERGVTWGHFFSNIGFTLSDAAFIAEDGTVYQDQGSKTLKFFVNGEQVEELSNELIENESQVLISFGNESNEQLQAQIASVEENAAYHNEHPDPGSCSGEIEADWWTKMKKAVL